MITLDVNDLHCKDWFNHQGTKDMGNESELMGNGIVIIDYKLKQAYLNRPIVHAPGWNTRSKNNWYKASDKKYCCLYCIVFQSIGASQLKSKVKNILQIMFFWIQTTKKPWPLFEIELMINDQREKSRNWSRWCYTGQWWFRYFYYCTNYSQQNTL